MNLLTETCDSYTDLNGQYNPPKKCPIYARNCCGTCLKRFCCDNLHSNKLNQLICKSNSTDENRLNKKY